MWNGVVTNAGKVLLAQWAQGGTLAVDGAKAGTGTVSPTQLMASRNVAGVAHRMSIINSGPVEGGGVLYTLQFITEAAAYTAMQVGIFASLDGGASTLIAIYQADSGEGVSVPATDEALDFAFTFGATVDMSNEGTLNVTIDDSAHVTAAAFAAGMALKANATDVYSKAAADALLADKANAADVYTKTQADALLADKADADDTYSKSEVDAVLAAKADASDVYTKTEVDNALSGKADASDTYTKSEVDTAVGGKASRTLYNATIPATGWTAQDGLYVCNVAVNGILPTDGCGGIGPVQTGTESTDKAMRSAWNKVVRIVAGANAITVYATAVPPVSIPILMEVMR